MATSPYRSWVEISRSQIARNYQVIKRAVGPDVAVMPVVKADAYRHGAIEVSKVLTSEGAEWLAVSNVEEGVALRLAGIDSRILVMADFLPVGRLAICEHDLTPVIHAIEDLRELNEIGSRFGSPIAFHLKIDSGMCRLGTRATAAEIAAALRANPYVKLEGLMTHFASVADFTKEQTNEQTACFLEVVAGLRDLGIAPPYVHLSSTGGIAYRRNEVWGNLVRPGHAIYGYVSPVRGSGPGSRIKVKPVMCWKAAVLTVKEIPQGATVGYGGMYRASEAMRIAVLAVGYADGIPHRLSNRGRVIACGRYAPILGAVSMDLTTIDVTQCPNIAVGQAVTILGTEAGLTIDAQEIARQAGTISYSVLCGISSRVKRVYL
ncbi:MAG TPA: alanine racemase [Bryobacteraceae bacterium]|nr:alanine racemase [Bryobacteraceae bacterium]